MRTDKSARRALAVTVGVASIFDLTGAITYRLVHPILPEPPLRDADPFQSAMSTILSSHRDAVTPTPDTSGRDANGPDTIGPDTIGSATIGPDTYGSALTACTTRPAGGPPWDLMLETPPRRGRRTGPRAAR